MVKTANDGYVRTFAMTHGDFERTPLRSNARIDALLSLKILHKDLRKLELPQRRKTMLIQHQDDEKDVLGFCILRELSHFDVSSSFMSDTLHNVYIGCFVSCHI